MDSHDAPPAAPARDEGYFAPARGYEQATPPRPDPVRAPVPPPRAHPATRHVGPLRSLLPWASVGAILVLLLHPAGFGGRAQPAAESGPWRPLILTLADSRPTPQPAESDVPLGPPPAPSLPGPHVFMWTQPGSAAPVAYDPCRPLRYVVNERTAPPNAAKLLTEAIAEVEQATGLRFLYEGTTDEPPSDARAPYQPQRYGDRWAPILIAWTDPAELPSMSEAAGRAGSVAARTAGGPTVFVTGHVLLNGDAYREMGRGSWGVAAGRRVVMHELGHLVGLYHVDDPRQVMAPASNVRQFGAGDRTGLAALGRGECVARL